MKLYRLPQGIFVEDNNRIFPLESNSWDSLIAGNDLAQLAHKACSGEPLDIDLSQALAPVSGQEVWAAGVTYYRSRTARIEESKGAGTFYDHVYEAVRPELFFKANGSRVVAPGGHVRIRRDARWSVPEPELALVINASGEIVGYTIGNDMSSRDIEGENPLYLPQAKMYDGSCALGPCILIAETPMPKTTRIAIAINRAGQTAFDGSTTLADLKRDPKELVEFLYRENTFPNGALLMTGTGIVPPDDFALAIGDIIRIEIEGIGALTNTVG